MAPKSGSVLNGLRTAAEIAEPIKSSPDLGGRILPEIGRELRNRGFGASNESEAGEC